MRKQAFMKTVEVFIAILVTFTFVLVVLPKEVPDINDQSIFRLRNLDVDDDFRNCVLRDDSACINTTIDSVFEGRFLYDYEIYDSGNSPLLVIDEVEVRTYSWFYAGNQTAYNPKTFKLFYWVPRAK
jgi:hypothetical protein